MGTQTNNPANQPPKQADEDRRPDNEMEPLHDPIKQNPPEADAMDRDNDDYGKSV